ncbi:MAG: tRNA-dihydrouridine synthase family protein [Bacteroidales bacterium]|nr:tRNA-dihydrouridine synthase family protein [Bacteroidales bacterium]
MNNPRLSLGPFQGITDAPFRNVFKKHFGGIDKYYTPFFTGIQKDHAKNMQVEEIDPTCNDVETLTPQILSTDAEEILRFASQCKALGYKEINLNMGCPFPRVANKKRGSGLLPYPEKIDAMLGRVFEQIEVGFSVKCRLGYVNPDEIYPVIEVFNKYPLSELIIHPRIGKQLYKGEADVQRFAELIPLIKAPLVYNGDIVSVESFERIREEVKPVNEFMLGRGLLANPFLAEEINCSAWGTLFEGASSVGTDATELAPLSGCSKASDRKNRLHSYVVDLYEDRLRHAGGSPKVLGRMKELWSYLMYSFDEPQDIWRKIKKINALKEYEDTVETVFREHYLIQ